MKQYDKAMKTFPLAALIRSVSVLSALAALATAQAQPTFSNISPDGSHLFQPSATLSFNANSALGVTNVSVALTSTTLPGASRLKTLTAGHGLTITGSATSLSVSATLSSNLLYSAVDSLSNLLWNNVGSAVPGDNTLHTVNDITGLSSRFYRAKVTIP